jgi:uncharacterized protein (DUF488 family)
VFYRRKILLALLQLFEGQLDKIRLQQLLFLFSIKQANTTYDFVPHNYGACSFSANADLTTMAAKGLLVESEKYFTKLDTINYLQLLKPDDLNHLRQTKAAYGEMTTNMLMKHTFIRYPFYAINSLAAVDLLDKDELEQVKAAKPHGTETILFTIGYEGISLEAYLVRLLKNDVKVLVDVRNNPLSMKFGFSKPSLKKILRRPGHSIHAFSGSGHTSRTTPATNHAG